MITAPPPGPSKMMLRPVFPTIWKPRSVELSVDPMYLTVVPLAISQFVAAMPLDDLAFEHLVRARTLHRDQTRPGNRFQLHVLHDEVVVERLEHRVFVGRGHGPSSGSAPVGAESMCGTVLELACNALTSTATAPVRR